MSNAKQNKFSGFKKTDRPSVGLCLIFDISGFTKFFNKPDIHYYMTDYINHIIDCVEVNIFGGHDYWNDEDNAADTTGESTDDKTGESTDALEQQPSMRKFLGDGMLYVWEDNEGRILSDPNFKIHLINRLWNVQLNFGKINKKLQETIPIGDLPSTVKFGIAQGTIYKLIENDNSIDFIGPCINLASRLVKYCPEINFIASARLDLPKEELSKHGYFKIIAKELRSFENEIVIIDRDDYSSVEAIDQARLFKEI